MNRKKVLIMGNIFSIRLTDEDKVHLQQRMNETGKNATEVFKSAIYFTKIDADLVDEIISNIGYYFEASRRTQISIDLLPLQASSTQISIEYETYSVFETILHKLQNEYVH